MPSKLHASDRESLPLAIAAARIMSQENRQAAVAKRLNISQSEISRLLKFAEKQRFYNPKPSIVRLEIADPDWDEAERLYFIDSELVRKIQSLTTNGIQCEVFVCKTEKSEFESEAAGRVLELLAQARCIGVMSGQTISKLVAHMKMIPHTIERRDAGVIPCIPLCGDPVHLMNQRVVDYSASHLAAALEKVLTGSEHSEFPCLIGVPAYLSGRGEQKRGAKEAIWQEFLERIPGYRNIFKKRQDGQRPWIEEVDAVVTGIGILATASDSSVQTAAFILERTHQDPISEEELRGLIFGDIGGLLVERSGLSSKQLQRVQMLNKGWTGVEFDHLKRVASKASIGGPPGIIVVAAGEAKAEMAREIIQRGLANQLIIDGSLADKLKVLS